jgi:hypothetical protein
MAEYYTHFSEALMVNDECASWIQNEIAKKSDEDDSDDDDAWPDFEYLIETSGPATTPKVVIIFKHNYDSSGSIDQVANLVSSAFKKFKMNGCWSITCTYGCNRPRAGEFSSCTALVSRYGVKWLSSSKWIEDQTNIIEKRQKK